MISLSRTYPVINKALARFSARKPLHEVAIEVEEIHPAETTHLPPVVMLDGDWDRVTDVQEETTWDAERKRTQGGKFQSQATIRYTFENVLATPWGCYKLGRSFRQAGKVDMGQLMRAKIVHRDAGYFGLPVAGMQYFGHWLRDGLPASLLRRPHEDLYFPINPSWHHAKAYSDFLNVDRLTDPLVFFDRLSVCIDIGQNRNRHERIRTIHRAFQSRLPPRSARGAFIRRGATGAARVLLNEDDVADMLAQRGFNVCSATDKLETILTATAGVDTIVAVEGSHWAHGYFAAREGAGHLTLNPSDRFNNQYGAYMPALNQRLATLVMERRSEGYEVDLSRLAILLDKLDEASRHQTGGLAPS